MKHLTTLHLIPVLVLALVAPAAPAQDGGVETTEVPAEDLAEELQALIDEFDEAMAAFYEKYQAAATDEERQELFSTSYPDPGDYAERFMEFAARHEGTPHAAKALAWVVSRVQGEPRGRALERLVADHVEDAAMADVCRALIRDRSPETPVRLRTILGRTPHREVKAVGSFALGLQLETQSSGKDEPERSRLLAEYESLMESCAAEYGDVELYPGYKSVAAAAEGELFEHRNLQVGMVAPDIEGEDLDGVPFKLSDYRGKVVMLDFWGHW